MGRALIIEDELLIALHVQTLLEDEGHCVVGTARTADDAVDLAKAHDLDVIIADIRLADGSQGHDAVARIRAGQEVAVIFVSGNVMGEDDEDLERFAPLAVLTKPFNPNSLIDALKSISRG
ncbi:response regulator [Pseudooctadecabacter sp.]|uniref:response regulator n=1 Tax=Pseudooctadecabacter sp. TaxID=1966338 RepID=UPI0025CCD92C|nr:response regulator [Pseudooctadecabacter sp.]